MPNNLVFFMISPEFGGMPCVRNTLILTCIDLNPLNFETVQVQCQPIFSGVEPRECANGQKGNEELGRDAWCPVSERFPGSDQLTGQSTRCPGIVLFCFQEECRMISGYENNPALSEGA
jgi:hypothetical protein